jgi:transposase-like protein
MRTQVMRSQTDWQPRSLLRKLSATDPSGASDRLIAQQDEIRTLRQQLAESGEECATLRQQLADFGMPTDC